MQRSVRTPTALFIKHELPITGDFLNSLKLSVWPRSTSVTAHHSEKSCTYPSQCRSGIVAHVPHQSDLALHHSDFMELRR